MKTTHEGLCAGLSAILSCHAQSAFLAEVEKTPSLARRLPNAEAFALGLAYGNIGPVPDAVVLELAMVNDMPMCLVIVAESAEDAVRDWLLELIGVVNQ